MPQMKSNLVPIARAAEREAYEWLEGRHPQYLTALEQAVTQGATPEEIKRFMIQYAGDHRGEIAQRLELAAREVNRIIQDAT